MNEDILFDNIYIGHSVEDAAALRKETYDVKIVGEKKAEEATKPESEREKPKSPHDLVFMDDPVLYIKEKTNLFIELVQKNPVDAFKFVPEVAAAIGLGIVTLLLIVFGGGAAAAAAPSADELKAACVAMLRKGLPIFFGSDVGKQSDSAAGIMDTDLVDWTLGFDVRLGLSKAERLRTGESQMTHAMVLTAVHLDAEGRPVRWRVENSGVLGGRPWPVTNRAVKTQTKAVGTWNRPPGIWSFFWSIDVKILE